MDKAMIQITGYLWSQSGQIALLVVVVAILGYALRRRSAHVRYLLWLLVVAKCLVPPFFGVAVPILPQPERATAIMPSDSPIYGGAEATSVRLSEETAAQAPAPLFQETSTASGFRLALSARGAMVVLWSGGLIAFLAMALIKAGRTMRRLRKERLESPAEIQRDIRQVLGAIGPERTPRVWLFERASQPFVWGLWRGDIYLPAGFVSLSDPEHRRHILAHELSHVLRLDAAINLLQILAQAIFWFHPLVWWANIRIRQEREKCCDEMAIARLGVQPRSYSRAIVEALLIEHKSDGLMPSLAIAGPAKNIEERIKTMLRPGKRFYRRPSLLAATCALALALLIVPTTLALTNRPADKTGTATVAEPTADQIEQQRAVSVDKLKKLALSIIMYTMDHEQKYPDELIALMPYFGQDRADELAEFISSDVEYLGAGKTAPSNNAQDLPLAYDLTLLRGGEGTNVAFADGHVEFLRGDRLDMYGIRLPESRLEVLEVRFEPIHQGKNVVHVTVKNTSDAEQVFATHIYTRSPDYGKDGVGWGTPFFETIKPQEKKPMRFVFKIQGPVTDRTYVNLAFYNPETQDSYESKRYFKKRQYTSEELPKAEPEQAARQPASPAEAQAVTQTFNQIQGYIRDKRYEQAWERFSKDYQMAEYQRHGFEWFRRTMEPTHPMHSAFWWERDEFLKLTPGQVSGHNGVLALTAGFEGQTWTIDFVHEDNEWKIDWIAGYTPAIIRM